MFLILLFFFFSLLPTPRMIVRRLYLTMFCIPLGSFEKDRVKERKQQRKQLVRSVALYRFQINSGPQKDLSQYSAAILFLKLHFLRARYYLLQAYSTREISKAH